MHVCTLHFPSQGVQLHQEPHERYPPPPVFEYKPIFNQQILQIISKMSPFKATGLSGLSSAVLTYCTDLLTPYLGCLLPCHISAQHIPTAMEDHHHHSIIETK